MLSPRGLVYPAIYILLFDDFKQYFTLFKIINVNQNRVIVKYPGKFKKRLYLLIGFQVIAPLEFFYACFVLRQDVTFEKQASHPPTQANIP